MKLIKFTSILLCIILLVAVFAGCDTPEESKADVTSKDSLLQNSEDVSETVSEETSEEGSVEVSEGLGFVIVDKRGEKTMWDEGLDTFYIDENYEYAFSNTSMHKYIIVEYEDGTSQNVKEAMADGKVTIADLDRFNIEYYVLPAPQ
ncbi:MAG: hypothetical protein II987_00905 [Clostridia bacterium]|nr:hypothetical protein [Clostridia bacterium]